MSELGLHLGFKVRMRFTVRVRFWVELRVLILGLGLHLGFKVRMRFRRVGRGVRWVRTHPPSPPRVEKVRLERAKDELTKKEKERQR